MGNDRKHTPEISIFYIGQERPYVSFTRISDEFARFLTKQYDLLTEIKRCEKQAKNIGSVDFQKWEKTKKGEKYGKTQ